VGTDFKLWVQIFNFTSTWTDW